MCLCLRVCREGWRVLGQSTCCCASSLCLPLPSRTAGSWTPGTCPLRSTSLRRHRSRNGIFFNSLDPRPQVSASVFQFMLRKSFCSISKNSKSSVISLRSVLVFIVLHDGAFKFSFLPLHNLTIRNFNGLNRQTLYFTKSGKKGKN